MKTDNKRRRYFIEKGFQLDFILKFCFIVIVSSLVILAMLFMVSQDSTTVAIENTKVIVKSTVDFILPIMTVTLLIVSVFSALVLSILTMIISHKIFGPLHRLKNEIDILKNGDFRRNFSIRTRDQVQELAKSLNDMCKSIREKQLELKKRVKAARSTLQQDTSSKIEGKEELLFRFEEIDNILNFFKLE